MAYEHNPQLLPVRDVIPHRPPHLWVDGVIACEPGVSAEGFWTPGPEHFVGHFEGEIQVLPGVKQVESAAQLGAYMMMSEDPGQTIPLFAEIESAKFLAPVFPGDTLTLSGETISRDKRNFKGLGLVMVGEDVTCEMIMAAVILPKDLGTKMINRSRRGPEMSFYSRTQTWVTTEELSELRRTEDHNYPAGHGDEYS